MPAEWNETIALASPEGEELARNRDAPVLRSNIELRTEAKQMVKPHALSKG